MELECQPLCEHLSWDSDFFGFRIARLNSERLTREMAAQVMVWCVANKVECLYFLADSTDQVTVTVAEEHRFRFVDIRMTFEKSLATGLATVEDEFQSGVIRLAEPAAVPSLRSIARVSHHDSRFYHDPNFLVDRCDDLYEAWIERSCNGYADAVFVAEFEGRPTGYITCHLRGEGYGQIGLIAVSAQAQGRGLGQRLVNASLAWFAMRGVHNVSVVTQGRNCQAQRLYQRCGFLTKSVQLWYHKWFALSL